MTEEAKQERVVVTITSKKKGGVLCGKTVLVEGQSAKVQPGLADWLVKNKLARLGGSDGAPTSNGPGELADWPGGESLAAVDITTRAQLEAIIKEKGDGWYTKISGIGQSTAAAIIEKLTTNG